jgi:putative aldouronate transport system permease protein
MACVMVVMLPVMWVFPFLQKYFVKGILIGAIKS